MTELRNEPESIEIVRPWNGQAEDRYVFITLVLMLGLSVFLLKWLYPNKDSDHIKIPNEIRQQLTALSNSAEEILMIEELDGVRPSLQTLKEMAIAPFDQVQLSGMAEIEWLQIENCFFGLAQLDSNINESSDAFFQLLLAFDTDVPTNKTHNENHNHIAIQPDNQNYVIGWRLLDSRQASDLKLKIQGDCPATINSAQWKFFTPSSE